MDEYCQKHPDEFQVVYTNIIPEEGGKNVNKKTVGMIMMGIGGIVAVVTLVLLFKWHPVHIGLIVASVGVGFGGYTLYKKA
jgi:hypothetical protein